MNVATLIHVLDKLVSENHALPGFLEQEVEVILRMPEADHHFGLSLIETPRERTDHFSALHLVVIPATHADEEPVAPAGRD